MYVTWSEAAFAVFTMVPKSTSSDGAYARPSVNLQLGRYYPQLRFLVNTKDVGFVPYLGWFGVRNRTVHWLSPDGAPFEFNPPSC